MWTTPEFLHHTIGEAFVNNDEFSVHFAPRTFRIFIGIGSQTCKPPVSRTIFCRQSTVAPSTNTSLLNGNRQRLQRKKLLFGQKEGILDPTLGSFSQLRDEIKRKSPKNGKEKPNFVT
ncbi:hypothetical protein AVEN_101786-1 [Araneus ventricosus]|uniref:Uncharacterized protein n=1 Tax=Araneus ventricosus TaxID=182803 RepID=A0A4Y2D180_ARAVE|nr:hypothetical protein AVEN_101786-1 [Araneus ventricosus]